MNMWNQKVKTGYWIFLLLLLAQGAGAYQMPTLPVEPTNVPLDSWSFTDPTNWTSDYGYAPVSFTNINFSYLGDGASLVVDTNVPAWLRYPVFNSDGSTNLTVQNGTVLFWFGPNWSSADDTNGGSGPGEYGRLFEAGSYTTNSSYGWWSLYVDNLGENVYFGAQTNNSLSNTYTLYAPIDWTTNYFHFIALTYSPTNVSLYLDGVLATNDPGGLHVWPGLNVLSNGFWMGSDSNGIYQAHGMFNNVATFNYPLDSNDVATIYNWQIGWYVMNPYNVPYEPAIQSGPSSPSTTIGYYQAISGIGDLQPMGYTSMYNGTNSYNVWLTNVTASAANNGTITFTIGGGGPGVPYDVFANSVLNFSDTTNAPWSWMGQGYQWNTYSITNVGSSICFIILGTPLGSDDNGLTDAFELLDSKTDPYIDDQDGSGLSDSWQVLLGLNPLVNQVAQPSTRSNYSYNPVDWWSGVSGIRSGTNTMDPEGNITQVSE